MLPFEVKDLADLCGRNPFIPKAYSKCEHAGHPPTTQVGLLHASCRVLLWDPSSLLIARMRIVGRWK